MSNTKQISVVQGLTELKTLDKRIEKLSQTLIFSAVRKGESGKINDHKEVSEFSKEVEETYKKFQDLVDYRDQLKKSIVESNAKTLVEIDGKKMTVAEAIEKKTSIKYKKTILSKMKTDLANSVRVLDVENRKVQASIDNLIASHEKAGVTKDSIQNVTEGYEKTNKYLLVDPLKVESKIKSLEEEITQFETTVDIVLSESNALTKIEVASVK